MVSRQTLLYCLISLAGLA